MKKWILLAMLGLYAMAGHAQRIAISSFADTSRLEIREAVQFLQQYAASFRKGEKPDYCRWFTPAQCRNNPSPDPIVHAITSDGNTYRMAHLATVYYAAAYPDYVHLKTLFAWQTEEVLTPFAITNHYVYRDPEGLRFHTELEHNAGHYKTVVNGPIQYVFPAQTPFNKGRSDSLLQRMKVFEKEWGFAPAKPFRYYYAATAREIAQLKGLDYVVGSDENNPSGYADVDSRMVYCQGLGENYFHEVLHLYLNPLYEKSPVNHGLVYYLGGSLGRSFPQQLSRLEAYLKTHPETDLSQYDKLLSRDKFLHIDHVVNALLCALVYEKEGVKGLRRLLAYADLNTLFRKEYGLERKDWDSFLRQKLWEYLPQANRP